MKKKISQKLPQKKGAHDAAHAGEVEKLVSAIKRGKYASLPAEPTPALLEACAYFHALALVKMVPGLPVSSAGQIAWDDVTGGANAGHFNARLACFATAASLQIARETVSMIDGVTDGVMRVLAPYLPVEEPIEADKATLVFEAPGEAAADAARRDLRALGVPMEFTIRHNTGPGAPGCELHVTLAANIAEIVDRILMNEA